MPENLMNSEHKATNQKYRDEYDRIFGKVCPVCGKKMLAILCICGYGMGENDGSLFTAR